MTEITYHLADIRERVAKALSAAGRDGEEVMIIAVSKQQPADRIAEAYRAGQTRFGESYVQEALAKMRELEGLAIEWHYIGPIQANKTRAIAECFHWVHSLDRDKVALRLDAQRPYHATALNVLIQVNIDHDARKSGVAPGGVRDLAALVSTLPNLRLRGLMGIAPHGRGSGDTRQYFMRMRKLQRDLEASGIITDTLSMGMSEDFEQAVAAGSTCVRIGTAIFGPR